MTSETADVALDCGWGRLLFGQTFADTASLLRVFRAEAPQRRDIAMYLHYPQVVVGLAPHELFVDPSLTFRLALSEQTAPDQGEQPSRCVIRALRAEEIGEQNRIYAVNHMVEADPAVIRRNLDDPVFTYLVAEGPGGDVLGTVTGIDHVAAFHDVRGGSSLWCLAVDPQAAVPGLGRQLVRALAAHLRRRGREFLDLSVLHDNAAAIGLYEQLGFTRVPVFAVKRKNPINEPLFTGDVDLDGLNPYARIIADEALRRGITVRVLDAAWGELGLTYAGRRVLTRESLSELTSAVAMSRCDDKRITRRVLTDAGLAVPRGITATGGGGGDGAFLAEVGDVVVKPARGEQGVGITVGVRHVDELQAAIEAARRFCPEVLLEERVDGDDLRVVVIDHQVVAAAVRRPATVVGTGDHSVAELIAKQSRRRQAATGGESSIPVDDQTRDVVAAAGLGMDDTVESGRTVTVRRTANLHTGGTIHDVTDQLAPGLVAASVRASEALEIPVVGLDLLVPRVDGPEHVFIEANERPGLANHEPRPTAQRFLDLLFPRTRRPGS